MKMLVGFLPATSGTCKLFGEMTTALLRKLAAVCTYGANHMTSFLLGDPPKRVVKRLVRSMPGHAVRCDYLAYYDMDHSNREQRSAFLERVNRTFEAW
jgi:NAD(P)H dehydrogenase (quinone)